MKKIKLTESDLYRLVKRVLEEQSILGSLSDPSNTGLDVNMDIDPKSSYGCLKTNSGKNKMSQLFSYCSKLQVQTNSPKVKQWNDRLYNSMKGLGTNEDLIKVFGELTSIQDLASIWKTFKYDGENLWQWIEGERKYDWDTIWNSIPDKVKSVAKIPVCLQYDKSFSA
jgi:hypothetical protein